MIPFENDFCVKTLPFQTYYKLLNNDDYDHLSMVSWYNSFTLVGTQLPGFVELQHFNTQDRMPKPRMS